MMGPFPATVGEVDAPWLTAVLRAAGVLAAGQHVAGFEVLPIGSGFGQTGDSVRLRLGYEPGEAEQAPQTMFAKFATQDPVRRQASQSLGLYRREVDFYSMFARQAKVRAPLCYFAAVSAEGDYATLLLEDFPEHRPGDDIAGLKVDEAELAVDLLADLHGPFWGRGNALGVPPLSMGTRERFVPAWEEMERSYGDQVPDALRRVREPFLDAIDPLHAWLVSEPTTLGHGDLKLDNLLFGPTGPDRIVAVDWQAVRPQRGMRDIAYLISHSMNVADRREHERGLLARYRERLSGYGIAYPADAAEDDYRLSMLFDFCTVLYIVGVNLNTNERAVRRKRALMERAVTALLDWDAFALLERFR